MNTTFLNRDSAHQLQIQLKERKIEPSNDWVVARAQELEGIGAGVAALAVKVAQAESSMVQLFDQLFSEPELRSLESALKGYCRVVRKSGENLEYANQVDELYEKVSRMHSRQAQS